MSTPLCCADKMVKIANFVRALKNEPIFADVQAEVFGWGIGKLLSERALQVAQGQFIQDNAVSR